jgi:hypothetical protein
VPALVGLDAIWGSVKNRQGGATTSGTGTSWTLRDVRLESGMRSKRAKQKCDVRFLKASRKPRRIVLLRGIVSLGPLAALFAFHLGLQLVERSRTQAGDLLSDHPERHPDRALAALASDPPDSRRPQAGRWCGCLTLAHESATQLRCRRRPEQVLGSLLAAFARRL